jgi:hypothetical protein
MKTVKGTERQTIPRDEICPVQMSQWSDLCVCIHSERNSIQLAKWNKRLHVWLSAQGEPGGSKMQRGFLEPNSASSLWHDERDKPAEANITGSKLSIAFIHLRTTFFLFFRISLSESIFAFQKSKHGYISGVITTNSAEMSCLSVCPMYEL